MTSAADDIDYIPDDSIYAFAKCPLYLIAECCEQNIYKTMLLKYIMTKASLEQNHLFLNTRPNRIQYNLLYLLPNDGKINPPLYPQWQQYFREHQPPTLIAWGKNESIFPADGAHPYKRDLKKIDFHLLDTGHFALEEDHELIAELISSFLKRMKSMQV